ncbi:MAG: hypothetical protein EXS05_16765 [Planctomycetaceae bacterium]|nr:hypothetical protein [Planctomycetaceae bacterium]
MTTRPHGPWQILCSQQVYKDPWLDVRKDDVIRPDGQRREGFLAVICAVWIVLRPSKFRR